MNFDKTYNNIKKFLNKYKIGIIIVISIIISIISSFIVIVNVYDPVKIKFEGENKDIITTSSKIIDMKALASNKKNEKFEISWEVSDGKLNKKVGEEVKWTLPEEDGVYTIKASSFNKEVSKNITVINNVLKSNFYYEKEDAKLNDSDADGLTDKYETTYSKTDFKNKDTDGDKISDGSELELGLNPLEKCSKKDNVEDGTKILHYMFIDKNVGAIADITGKEDIVKTNVEKYNNDTLEEFKFVVSDVFDFHSEGKITNAKITLNYDTKRITQKNINEEKLSIYEINFQTANVTKIKSTVDKIQKNISGEVDNIGKYFIADSSKFSGKISTDLMLLIDNSGSMFSSEELAGSMGNDILFKRVDLANKLIDNLKGDYRFGAGKFTFNYSTLAKLTSNKELVKKSINTIKTNLEDYSGTYIGEALYKAIEEFDITTNRNKIIILLNDGKDTKEVKGYDKEKLNLALNEAIKKEVKVITIGLGKDIDQNILKNIAQKTNGKFYYSKDAEGLQEIFDTINSKLNYELIDLNKDLKADSIKKEDTEIDIGKDTFMFDNFPIKNNLKGANYGMSLFTKLYYEKVLPNKMDGMSIKDSNTSETIKAEGYNIGGMLRGEPRLGELEFIDLKLITQAPKDFRNITPQKNILIINPKYKEELINKGFEIYNQVYNHKGAKFNIYENYILDMNSEKFKKNMKSDESNLIKAFYRLDITKYKAINYSFIENSKEAYEYIIEKMKLKESILLKINNDYTVLATKIIIDLNDSSKLKIEVYDPNDSKKLNYIEVQKIKMYEKEGNSKNEYEFIFRYKNRNVNIEVNVPNLNALL